MAQGAYITYIDSDDTLAPDYLSSIYQAIEQAYAKYVRLEPDALPDVIVYDIACSENGSAPYTCRYSLAYDYERVIDPATMRVVDWRGPPSHMAAWKRDLVKDLRFPEINNGEDSAWAQAAKAVARTELQLNKTLYTYNFNATLTTTRGA